MVNRHAICIYGEWHYILAVSAILQWPNYFADILAHKLEANMCLAIPAQIVELQPSDMARVRVGESSTFLSASTMLLADPPKVGDYVIVHAGFALHVVPPEEAEKSLETLREIAEAACGVKANF